MNTPSVLNFESFLKMFCIVGFSDCRKGNSGATLNENNLFAISSVTRSTGMLVKRLVISKRTNFASFLGFSSLILSKKLEVEGKE